MSINDSLPSPSFYSSFSSTHASRERKSRGVTKSRVLSKAKYRKMTRGREKEEKSGGNARLRMRGGRRSGRRRCTLTTLLVQCRRIERGAEIHSDAYHDSERIRGEAGGGREKSGCDNNQNQRTSSIFPEIPPPFLVHCPSLLPDHSSGNLSEASASQLEGWRLLSTTTSPCPLNPKTPSLQMTLALLCQSLLMLPLLRSDQEAHLRSLAGKRS